MLIFFSQILMLFSTVISFYIWLLIAQAILSWLVAFSILNTQNKLIYLIGDFLYKISGRGIVLHNLSKAFGIASFKTVEGYYFYLFAVALDSIFPVSIVFIGHYVSTKVFARRFPTNANGVILGPPFSDPRCFGAILIRTKSSSGFIIADE